MLNTVHVVQERDLDSSSILDREKMALFCNLDSRSCTASYNF